MTAARLVLDSSVLIAAIRPSEPAHADALDFIRRLRTAQAAEAVQAFGPAELWLEVHVAEQRLASSGKRLVTDAGAMHGLSIELVAPRRQEDILGFLEELTRRTHGKRPFANATDLVYVWVAVEVGAALVTLDEGLIKYHRVVCEVMRPQHVHFG